MSVGDPAAKRQLPFRSAEHVMVGCAVGYRLILFMQWIGGWDGWWVWCDVAVVYVHLLCTIVKSSKLLLGVMLGITGLSSVNVICS